ncbi:unnamed protein product [Leptosia nina]|uniref:Uncharacterized protein n=1 Tax=Leptosia nina TaxID=320188 RepID=A0AAV1JMP4_9NEOP
MQFISHSLWSGRVLSVSVATNACVGRDTLSGCASGLSGVYRSGAGACAAVSAAGGIPCDFSQFHPRAAQSAAGREASDCLLHLANIRHFKRAITLRQP